MFFKTIIIKLFWLPTNNPLHKTQFKSDQIRKHVLANLNGFPFLKKLMKLLG